MYIKNSDYWMFEGIASLKDSINDGSIIKAIKIISSEIDEYCNTRFEPTKDSYTLDLTEKFYTRRRPLISVTSLSLCGSLLTTGKDYYVYTNNSKVETCGLSCRQYKKALEIHYSYGYKTVPATIKQVTADLLKLDAESKSFGFQGMQSESWDNEYSYTRQASKDFTPAELRKNILARLDAFKVPPFEDVKTERTVKARLL